MWWDNNIIFSRKKQADAQAGANGMTLVVNDLVFCLYLQYNCWKYIQIGAPYGVVHLLVYGVCQCNVNSDVFGYFQVNVIFV